MLRLLAKPPPRFWSDRRPQMDRLQQADENQERDHRGAAVADERQRDTCHRHDTNRHPDVHEHLEQDHHADASGEDAPVHVARQDGDPERAPDKESIEHQEHRCAQEPVAFADHGEDEVGVVLRKEVQRGLRRHVPAAGERARSDGDHGLDDVVAGPLGVLAGVDEDEQPVELVLLDEVDAGQGQHLERDDEGGEARRSEDREVRPRRAVEVQHGQGEHHDHHRRAEVRLLVDEERRHGPQREDDDGDALGPEQSPSGPRGRRRC